MFPLHAVIDTISHSDFGYSAQPGGDRERGGLDWKLLHFWIGAQGEGQRADGQEDTDAFPSPTMIGEEKRMQQQQQ